MSVTVAAAAAFLTPVATPVNLMVMGPGGYQFGDYWKLGLPLMLWFFVVATFDRAAVLVVPLIRLATARGRTGQAPSGAGSQRLCMRVAAIAACPMPTTIWSKPREALQLVIARPRNGHRLQSDPGRSGVAGGQHGGGGDMGVGQGDVLQVRPAATVPCCDAASTTGAETRGSLACHFARAALASGYCYTNRRNARPIRGAAPVPARRLCLVAPKARAAQGPPPRAEPHMREHSAARPPSGRCPEPHQGFALDPPRAKALGTQGFL